MAKPLDRTPALVGVFVISEPLPGLPTLGSDRLPPGG